MKHFDQIDPFTYPIHYYVILSLWCFICGLVRVINSKTEEDVDSIANPTLKNVLKIYITGTFIGVIVFWIMEAYNFPKLLIAAVVSYSSYLGSDLIGCATTALKLKLKSYTKGL